MCIQSLLWIGQFADDRTVSTRRVSRYDGGGLKSKPWGLAFRERRHLNRENVGASSQPSTAGRGFPFSGLKGSKTLQEPALGMAMDTSGDSGDCMY